MKYLLKYTWTVIAFVLLSTSVSWGGDYLKGAKPEGYLQHDYVEETHTFVNHAQIPQMKFLREWGKKIWTHKYPKSFIILFLCYIAGIGTGSLQRTTHEPRNLTYDSRSVIRRL